MKPMPAHKLAKELGVTSKELMAHLAAKAKPARSAIAMLTQEQVDLALEHFTGAGAKPTPAPAAKVEPPPPPPPAPKAPEPPPPPPPPPPPARRTYAFTGPITLGELARAMDLKVPDIIREMLQDKQMITVNQRLGIEVVKKVGAKFGFEVAARTAVPVAAAAAPKPGGANGANLKPRPPVVTIMGHVDHGKTSLLDAIRKTDVAAGEAGGITQHISAFRVSLPGRGDVVFLDTPGHEAFTTLRARGAQVTDVVVLVVAADDGVMPQTIEAIDHARAAKVPIVVAINKMDKPEANPQRVMQQLAERELVPEEWGGKTIMVPVSARKREGLDKLLEMLLLESELLELKADPDGPAEAIVLEARMHRSRGPVVTVLVRRGRFRVGDIVTCGSAYGRVRMMLDDKGAALTEAGPATPMEVLGLSTVPESGAALREAPDERTAREDAERHAAAEQESRLRKRHMTLQDLSQQVQSGEAKELRLILKADVQGSLEALRTSVLRLTNPQVKLLTVHEGIGPVSRSDVALAAASDAVIVAFNTGSEPGAEAAARQEHVEVRQYDVIYTGIEELKKAMEGMLAPKVEEAPLGRVEVRATFRTPRGTVAGCFVTSGKAVRGEKLRVLRTGRVVFEGTLNSLRRFKDDVKEVAQGYECGISVEAFNDFQVGDVLDVYTQNLVQEKLRL